MHDFIEKIGPKISVDEMRLMKAKEDARKRWELIARVVKHFYNEVIQFAKTYDSSYYFYSYKNHNDQLDKFISENEEDIVKSIQHLFPESQVSFEECLNCDQGKNRQRYQICDSLSEDAKQIMDRDKIQRMIVISWA